MQPYFNTDYASIGYDENAGSIVAGFKMPPLSDEFRAYMNALLSAMEYFKTGKIVADTTKMGTLHPHDQEWSYNEWNGKAVKVGYSHAAILLPPDVYSQMAIEDTMNAVIGAVTFSYFGNMEHALTWIASA